MVARSRVGLETLAVPSRLMGAAKPERFNRRREVVKLTWRGTETTADGSATDSRVGLISSAGTGSGVLVRGNVKV